MIPKDDYTCPRCGYVTHQKSHMRNHLYKKIKSCPSTKNDIELTNEIKEHILANKIYKVPKTSPQQIIINQINNNQQILNCISKIDPLQKLNTYIEHANIDIVDFEEHVKELLEDQITMCENMTFDLSSFSFHVNILQDIVEDMIVPSTLDKFNVIYDKGTDKLLIYNDSEWEKYPFETGVKDMIEKLQYTYLDKYEEMLLAKYDHDHSLQERKRAEEQLQSYYSVIIAFQVTPYIVNGQTKEMLEYNDKYYHHIFKRTSKSITMTQMKDTKKSIYSMIKRNSALSIEILNKKLIEAFCEDQSFKYKVLQLIQS